MPTTRDVHVDGPRPKPWSATNPPEAAKNFSDPEKFRCITAANRTLMRGGTEQEAIQACIRAAKNPTIGKAGLVPPDGAKNAAKRVLEWRDKYGDEVKGMTRVGWTRASQLASGQALSEDVVRRMAQFARHKNNYEAAKRNLEQDRALYRQGKKRVAPKPWHYAGIVAWLGWGSDAGINWAKRESEKMKKFRINDEVVTVEDLVKAWLGGKERFTSVPWSNPESDLSPEDFAKVSLIDLNPPGQEKVKANIKLPVRSKPGGAINTNALRNAASRIFQMKGVPDGTVRQAARKLVSLMEQAGIEVGSEDLQELVGKSDWQLEIQIAKAQKQLVYGVVLKPDAFDSQGDRVSVEEIEKAAHSYMINSQGYDYHHQEPVAFEKVRVVESYLAPCDLFLGGQAVKEGSWVVVSKVFDPLLWDEITKGDIQAYSIFGTGKRKSLDK